MTYGSVWKLGGSYRKVGKPEGAGERKRLDHPDAAALRKLFLMCRGNGERQTNENRIEKKSHFKKISVWLRRGKAHLTITRQKK